MTGDNFAGDTEQSRKKTHHEMALLVDYYRTALGWKEVDENGAELDEPRTERGLR